MLHPAQGILIIKPWTKFILLQEKLLLEATHFFINFWTKIGLIVKIMESQLHASTTLA